MSGPFPLNFSGGGLNGSPLNVLPINGGMAQMGIYPSFVMDEAVWPLMVTGRVGGVSILCPGEKVGDMAACQKAEPLTPDCRRLEQ